MQSRNHLSAAADNAAPLLGNRLLDTLPAHERDTLLDGVRIVSLSRGTYTHEQRHPLKHVDFPIDAVMSIVATLENGNACEVAVVGREGFVEVDAALDGSSAERSSVCQIGGRVARISLEAFRASLEESPEFNRLVHRVVRARLFLTEQMATCNLKHSVLQRLARWLLTTGDRLGSETIPLTHEALSILLGARRAGVSIAAAALQRDGALEYRRGSITLVDKAKLRGVSCECYQVTQEAIDRSFVREATR